MTFPVKIVFEGSISKEKLMRNVEKIDFALQGDDLQMIEIGLNEGERVIAKAGAFMYMEKGIHFETYVDAKSVKGNGLLAYTNSDVSKRSIAFSAPSGGNIIPIDLREYNGQIICQSNAFLCAAKVVSINIAFQRKIGFGIFGEKGFAMKNLKGDGLVYIHASGAMVKRVLKRGEMLRVDTGCLLAMTSDLDHDIQVIGGINNTFNHVEDVYMTSLSGPGTVWLQSTHNTVKNTGAMNLG